MAATDISKKDKKKAQKKAKKGKGSRSENKDAIASMRADFQVSTGGGDEAPEKPKKKGAKLLLFGAIALVISGAGATGAWMFLLQSPEDEAVAVVEAPPEEVPKAYVEAEPVHIAFKRRNGQRSHLVVFLTLEVAQRDRNVAKVRQAMPRLQEAFWRNLNGEPLPGADVGAIELTAVKERLRIESERVLGPGIVRNVLIRDARVVQG